MEITEGVPRKSSSRTRKASGEAPKGYEVRRFWLRDDEGYMLTLPPGWVPFAAVGPAVYAYKVPDIVVKL